MKRENRKGDEEEEETSQSRRKSFGSSIFSYIFALPGNILSNASTAIFPSSSDHPAAALKAETKRRKELEEEDDEEEPYNTRTPPMESSASSSSISSLSRSSTPPSSSLNGLDFSVGGSKLFDKNGRISPTSASAGISLKRNADYDESAQAQVPSSELASTFITSDRIVPTSSRSLNIQDSSSKDDPSRKSLHKRRKFELHSVRKQKIAKSVTNVDAMKKQFLSVDLKDAKSKGFQGSEKDLEGLMKYIREVQNAEDKENRDFTPAKRAIIRPAPQSKTTEPAAAAKKEPSFIEDLREIIRITLLKKPEPADEFEPAITKKYDELVLAEAKRVEERNAILKALDEADAGTAKVRIPTDEELFPPLSPQDLDRVKTAQRANGEVVKAFNVSMQGHDVKTLAGSTWLNDEIINFYAELCMDRAKKDQAKYPKIHVFNTFFYQKLSSKEGFTAVRRWTKKFDIFEKDYIIIPIHMGMHWCCAVINFKVKRFEYYDSLHGNNQKCLSLLRDYLNQESQHKKGGKSYDTSDWTDYTPKDCPNQMNGFDCGVFTCMFMEFTARGLPFLFEQKHMQYLRNRICLEILNIKLIGEASL